MAVAGSHKPVGESVSEIDIEHLRQWVGKQEVREEVIALHTARAMAATLDWEKAPDLGDQLPAPWHWLYFLATERQSCIGSDGHPQRGGFLPPVTLPRRMWASGNILFAQPLHVGDSVKRISTVASVDHKVGGSGDLVFVVVRHEIYVGDHLAVSEDQNIVYRADPDPNAAPPPAVAPRQVAKFSRELRADPVLLFRFSALTFNSHRIHYDRDYAVNEEGYPGLVVQGPLSATLLLDLARNEGRAAGVEGEVDSYDYRALRPLIAGHPFHLQGCRDEQGVSLWVVDHLGAMTMQARVGLRPASAGADQ